MNRTIALKFIPFAFCGLAMFGGAAAQQGQQQGEPPVVGTATIGITVAEADIVATGYRASKLLRADVYNDNNQKIGKIDDLIITPDGKLSVAVVNVGGFLGLKRHRVAIPVDQFTQMAPRIVLPGATKEALKEMPDFQYSGKA